MPILIIFFCMLFLGGLRLFQLFVVIVLWLCCCVFYLVVYDLFFGFGFSFMVCWFSGVGFLCVCFLLIGGGVFACVDFEELLFIFFLFVLGCFS